MHRIKHTYILEDPYDDPPQLAEMIPDASPEGKPKDEVMAYLLTICSCKRNEEICCVFIQILQHPDTTQPEI